MVGLADKPSQDLATVTVGLYLKCQVSVFLLALVTTAVPATLIANVCMILAALFYHS
jgi:hypothetical protein